MIAVLLARDDAALGAKRSQLDVPAPFRGFAGTLAEFVDLAGQYRGAGVQLLIGSA